MSHIGHIEQSTEREQKIVFGRLRESIKSAMPAGAALLGNPLYLATLD